MNSIHDFQAGPGSYDLASEIGKKSFVYSNLPMATMARGPKVPKVYLPNDQKMYLKGEISPSVQSYYPNYEYLYKNLKGASFGSQPRPDYFSSMSKRSPGPGYDPKKLTSTGVVFPQAGVIRRDLNGKSLKKVASLSRYQLMDTRKLFDSNAY